MSGVPKLLTLYHGTFARHVPSIIQGVTLGSMQASDFSAGDRRRPFYTTQDPNCARLWAIQYHTWMNAFGVPQKLAVVKFTFDPTTFKFHDFGKVVTPEWQEFVWKNYQFGSVSDPHYQSFDVIAGPMSQEPGVRTAKDMTIWKWPNGVEMNQVAITTDLALSKLVRVSVDEFTP